MFGSMFAILPRSLTSLVSSLHSHRLACNKQIVSTLSTHYLSAFINIKSYFDVLITIRSNIPFESPTHGISYISIKIEFVENLPTSSLRLAFILILCFVYQKLEMYVENAEYGSVKSKFREICENFQIEIPKQFYC